MPDKEEVIKGCELIKEFLGDGLPGKRVVFNTYINILNDAITLLKEQEEQKQKWLKQIADAQIAVCPTGNETEEGLAKRTGEWNGLQMAWDILTNGR